MCISYRGCKICVSDTGTVRFETISAVVISDTMFWDVTPCSLVDSTNVSEEFAASDLK